MGAVDCFTVERSDAPPTSGGPDRACREWVGCHYPVRDEKEHGHAYCEHGLPAAWRLKGLSCELDHFFSLQGGFGGLSLTALVAIFSRELGHDCERSRPGPPGSQPETAVGDTDRHDGTLAG